MCQNLFRDKLSTSTVYNLNHATKKIGEPWGIGIMLAKKSLTIKLVYNRKQYQRQKTRVLGIVCVRTFACEGVWFI